MHSSTQNLQNNLQFRNGPILTTCFLSPHGGRQLHQEVVLFLLTPGSKVRLHNGGSNAPINLSLGLTGSNGAFLEVSGEAG